MAYKESLVAVCLHDLADSLRMLLRSQFFDCLVLYRHLFPKYIIMGSPSFDEKTHNSEPVEISASLNVAPGSLDDNYELYKSMRDVELDSAEAKKVLRKIDLRIQSILMVTYFLQYLDKNCVNLASVYGLQKNTHLKGQDYAWLSSSLLPVSIHRCTNGFQQASMFYIGYLVFQFPFGYLQRLPTGRLLSITIIACGIVLITTPACTSFAGIATNRFFLGALESDTNPGFVLLMLMWYTTAEQPLRLEAYYSTIGIATMFSGLMGYAVGHITTGLSKWMYIFLIFGAITIA
jgi:hypothetical protein